jgi:ABC-type amino acid transport system permease subunit
VEWLTEAFEFLARVNWVRVTITVLATLTAVVLGIWAPARMLEFHTRQPAVRYIWYVLGTLILIMVYVSMYGYGLFWELYSENSLEGEPHA